MSSRFSGLRFSAAASELSGPESLHWGVKKTKVAIRSRRHLTLVKGEEKKDVKPAKKKT